MRKADVSDAFRDVRVDPKKAHNFCYTVGEFVVIDFRLAFEWSGSPGFWCVMLTASEHAHCNTTIISTQLLEDRPNRVGLASLGSRAVVRTGGGGCNAYRSPQEEDGLRHRDRRARVHYQLAHHENLVFA